MKLVNRVSAFQNYQNFSDVIAVAMNQASENSELLKNDSLKLSVGASVVAS